MKQFKVRYTSLFERLVTAESPELAVEIVTARMTNGEIRVLGAVPADQEWPCEEKEVVVRPQPPRGRPTGGGSPGTPTLPAAPENVQAVAA